MPKLSIIVPVYNISNYISKCIESILCQEFTDFECIIVVDGAADDSSEICDRYAARDRRIKVIQKKNSGVSAARNIGIAASCGEYITFCDGDDYYTSGWLGNLMTAMQETDADYVTAGYQYISEEGETLITFERKQGSWYITDEDLLNDYLVRNVLYSGNGWEVWSAVFKRQIIVEDNIRFCETCGNYAEDLAFVLCYVLFAKRLMAIGGTGYRYVKHSGSMINRNATEIKMDSLNEVSKFFSDRYLQVARSENKYDVYRKLHFFIMHMEAARLLNSGRYTDIKRLPEEYARIKDSDWDRRNTVTFNFNERYITSKLRIDAEYMADKKSFKYYIKRKSLKVHSFLIRRIERVSRLFHRSNIGS